VAWLVENWVWLLFGGGMIAMHLFGHKGHGGHAQKKEQNDDSADSARHIDPVCRKVVDTDQGYGMIYESVLRRFCSRECLDRFEAEPAAYLAQEKPGA